MCDEAGNNWYLLPLKSPEEDKEDKQIATVSPAATKETSVNARVAALSAELETFSYLKKGKELEAFLVLLYSRQALARVFVIL